MLCEEFERREGVCAEISNRLKACRLSWLVLPAPAIDVTQARVGPREEERGTCYYVVVKSGRPRDLAGKEGIKRCVRGVRSGRQHCRGA